MDFVSAFLDSWNRQCAIVESVADLITESNKQARPTPDGMPLFAQLAHIHSVRRFFLGQIDPNRQSQLGKSYLNDWSDPIEELGALREMLKASGDAVTVAVRESIEKGLGKAGWYDNQILYVQHLIWHEGWHVGQIFQALRAVGEEPSEEWEEEYVWGQWRTETW